jgi:hypothetical protein
MPGEEFTDGMKRIRNELSTNTITKDKAMKKTVSLTFIILTMLMACIKTTEAQSLKRAINGIAFQEQDKFGGWPANNGLWTWDNGKEILVGYTYGNFVEQKGHNIEGMSEQADGLGNRLARSTDGGLTWESEEPENYVGTPKQPIPSPGGIDFQSNGFAMRVVGTAYHGAHDGEGHFFVSDDRGKVWQGPYRFNGLMDDPNLKGLYNTARTEYIVTGPNSCLVFMSARESLTKYNDKTFVAETTDGGKTFQFLSWIVPLSDPDRAVMPQAVRLKDGSLVVAMRRRNGPKDWGYVDVYGSKDNGRTWEFLSKVGDTGKKNGNPPALVALKDGRLACAYGDRSRGKLFLRISSDGGISWEKELMVRDDFQADSFGDMDFGYPQLAENHKKKIVAMYYWATKENYQQHIATTIFKP